MSWPSDFYSRQKNPWIGFVLVVLLGPFGFLYHSWKTAIAILLIVGPLWIEFLRHTRYDLIENPWAHYTALLLCGGFAALQINAHNVQMKSRLTNPPEAEKILGAAISMLPTDESRASLIALLKDQPALAAKFFHSAALLTDQPSCWRFSTLFDEIGVTLAKEGDFPAATTSLGCSSLFMEDSPLMFAAKAEVYCEWQDLIAGRYATKVMRFRTAESTSVDLEQFLSSETGRTLLRHARARMEEIISTCQMHPEWRDSYDLKSRAGIADV